MAKAGKNETKTQRDVNTRANADVRRQLLRLLEGGGAHATFEDAIQDLPPELRGVAPPGAPHTAWELLEHMRIAQSDILEFCRDPEHVSPEWPSGYWPEARAPEDDAAWAASVKAFRIDLDALRKLVGSSRTDMFARVQHPEAAADTTLLREALLVADHNAYHLGELVFLRRILGAWPAR